MRAKDWLRSMLPGRVAPVDPDSLPVEGRMPEFAGISSWLNTNPVTTADLRGKVVLVEFWTYSCINCIRTLPHVNAWYETYRDQGLEVIGIHTPEFEFEKDLANVQAAVARHGISYPVALDNGYTMWDAYRNHYWPAHYFIDGKGNVRYHRFGEGEYAHSETIIKALLRENGTTPAGTVVSEKVGPEPDLSKVGTPETYLGFERMEYLGSPESVRTDVPRKYSSVPKPGTGAFYLDGTWEIRDDYAIPIGPDAKIVYRVRASTMNLVMDGGGRPHRVIVSLDGGSLGHERAGVDMSPDEPSTAVVTEGRLYNLVDLHDRYEEHLLEVSFPDPDIKVYAFTFG